MLKSLEIHLRKYATHKNLCMITAAFSNTFNQFVVLFQYIEKVGHFKARMFWEVHQIEDKLIIGEFINGTFVKCYFSGSNVFHSHQIGTKVPFYKINLPVTIVYSRFVIPNKIYKIE